MPVTKLQLEKRKKHLGSSDMAALLGLSPWRTRYDVFCEKTDRLPDDLVETAAMKAGNYFEDGVLAYAEDLHGPLVRNQYRSIKDSGVPLGANVDALIVRSGEPIEAKTVGFLGYTNEVWGGELTDEVPDRVLIQAHVHMLCTERELCHIAAFIAGRGFVPYLVRLDESVANIIKETAVDFWNRFVLTDTPPDDSLPSAKIVTKMRRQPKSVVPIDAALVKDWQQMKLYAKLANEVAEESKIKLLAALGDAESGTCDLGVVKYLEQTRREHTVAESTFRVLRFQSNKQEKT